STSTLGLGGVNDINNVSTGTAGNIFNISTSSNSLVINLPLSTITNTGQLSNTDWATFNNKLSGSLTSGQVVYASAASTTASSSNFLWDNTAKSLIINSSTPAAATLLVVASSSSQVLPIFQVASTTGSSFFKIAVNGSTTLSSLGTGPVRAVGGELNIGAITLSGTDVTGILPVANGGTNSSTLGTTLVGFVSNDTNVTGSIANNTLTLGWTGVLAVNRGGIGTSTAGSAGTVAYYDGTT